MIDEGETEALVRQARRLETASSIIHEIHGSLSLGRVVEGVVENLVEVGGFAGAQIRINATIDSLVLAHEASAGAIGNDDCLIRRTPVFIRGDEIGELATYYRSVDSIEDQSDLLEFILPTLYMAIDHAVSYAEIDDYRATLEDKVEQRTTELVDAHAQLQRTVEDLREARAARDVLFANINHEIRTPLTLIQLAVETVERSEAVLADGTRDKLDDIKGSVRRLVHLVNTLLLLAAGGEGKLETRPRPNDVALTVVRLLRSWGSAAERAGIQLAYHGPESFAATIDENVIETIVGNLVSNAVKFTPSGGSISVSLLDYGSEIAIEVRDTGAGIDPEFMTRMFGRFARAKRATTEGISGSGIGLSLTKELIELQHGRIEVTRHDTGGTSFRVTIPRHQNVTGMVAGTPVAPPVQFPEAAPERVPRKPRPAVQAPKAAPSATVLLAEDEPALQAQMVDILAAHYRVVVASNGIEALELAKQHVPDVLVTDLEMPDMNGIELTQQFLALQGRALSPVLIVSAHAGLGQRLAGFEAGAVDYVVKPFSADELLARIRSQLALRTLALKLHETEKLASMGVMSAGLAHELRNPANAIVNALEPLWELMPAEERDPKAAGAQLYDVMKTAAKHMRELCSNILNVSRDGGAMMGRPENITAILRRVRLVVAPLYKTVELVSTIEIEERVQCAGPLIEQILINLLDNAAYAAGSGGRVTVHVRREGELAVIEVGDSGPGVPPALQDRIFDPFFTTKPAGQGTGLGLAVSRRIALNHGGDLRFVRREQGSAFRLELPLRR